MRTGPNREAPRQDRRATRRALRLDVEVEKSRALGPQLVDARRRRAAHDAATVTPDLAVAEVVHQDKNDVRLRCLWSWSDRMFKSLQRWRDAGTTKGGRSRQRDAVTQCLTAAHWLFWLPIHRRPIAL